MRTNIKIIFVLLLTLSLFSCGKDEQATNLKEYMETYAGKINETRVIACAAGNPNNIKAPYIFFYPLTGATDIRYYEMTSTDLNKDDFSLYQQVKFEREEVFNGKLNRFLGKNEVEKWSIITYTIDGELHYSNPVLLNNWKKPTVWNDEVTITTTEFLHPTFSWSDDPTRDNFIYFSVVADAADNFYSGVYTFEQNFTYYDLSNVAFHINTATPPALVKGNDYKYVMMGVDKDNWVNQVIRKGFKAE